ncbi:hypothetical protein A9W94_00580 [Mycobacterium asiaticum]|nr:hypothetical protein A9W94_00580 [Mycobacterium asiaticum]
MWLTEHARMFLTVTPEQWDAIDAKVRAGMRARVGIVSRTTVCRSNSNIVTASINLGQLLFVRKYESWHGQSVAAEARFQNGSIDLDEATLIQFVRQGQEVLASPPHDPDLSGATADLGEPA